MPISLEQLVFITTGLVIILIGLVTHLYIKLRMFLKGKDGKTLEDLIISSNKELDNLKEFEKDSIEYFKDVERRLKRSVQSTETIRFNPFRGTGEGGNQSFATISINENGDGVIISSLYSRDRVSIFCKPVNKFESNFELTEEEKEILKNSIQKLK